MIKREQIIMVAIPLLALAIMIVWVPQFFKQAIEGDTEIDQTRQDKGVEDIENFIQSTQLTKRSVVSMFADWGRNPFYAPVIEVKEVETWPLKGIFWSEENPSALLGDQIIVVGDKLGEFVVTNILPDTVVISDGHQVIKLYVGKDNPK